MSEFDSLGLAGVFWPHDAEADGSEQRTIYLPHFQRQQLQQQANENMRRMLMGLSNMPEPKAARAQRIAAEFRARRPEMQVKRIPTEQQGESQ